MADKRVQIEFVTMGDAKATLKEMAQLSGQAADAQERLNKAERDYQSLLRQRPGIGGPGPVGGAGGASDIGSYGISYSSSAGRPTGGLNVYEAFGTYGAIRLAEQGQAPHPVITNNYYTNPSAASIARPYAPQIVPTFPGNSGAATPRRAGVPAAEPVVLSSSGVMTSPGGIEYPDPDQPLNVHGTYEKFSSIRRRPDDPHPFQGTHDPDDYGGEGHAAFPRRPRGFPTSRPFGVGLPPYVINEPDPIEQLASRVGGAMNAGASRINRIEGRADSWLRDNIAAPLAANLGPLTAGLAAGAAAITMFTNALNTATAAATTINSPFTSGEARARGLFGALPLVGPFANAAYNFMSEAPYAIQEVAGFQLPWLNPQGSTSQQMQRLQTQFAGAQAVIPMAAGINRQAQNARISGIGQGALANAIRDLPAPAFGGPVVRTTAAHEIAYQEAAALFGPQEQLHLAHAAVAQSQGELAANSAYIAELRARTQQGGAGIANMQANQPGGFFTSNLQSAGQAVDLGMAAMQQMQDQLSLQQALTRQHEIRVGLAQRESTERRAQIEYDRTRLQLLEAQEQRLRSQFQGFGGAGIAGQIESIAAFQRVQMMAPQGAALPGDIAAISAINPMQGQMLAQQNAQNSPLLGFAQQIGLIEQGSLAGIGQQINQQRLQIAGLTRQDTAQLAADIRDSFLQFGDQIADTIRESQAAAVALIRAKLQMGAAVANAGGG